MKKTSTAFLFASLSLLWVLACVLLVSIKVSIAGEPNPSSDSAPPTPTSSLLPLRGAFDESGPFVRTASKIATMVVASGFASPWALAFLPDKRMLVTGRKGAVWIVESDGSSRVSLGGVPSVFSGGQGGLMDVALDPDFASNKRVYLTFSESGSNGTNGTAVARATLNVAEAKLEGLAVIYRQTPKVASEGHFGSRLAFDRDGYLFVTLGERQAADQRGYAQDLSRGHGKIVRITTDGAPAPSNPFMNRTDSQKEIWSYGHRNPQGAAIHPTTGELWASEHGPQGGDEINVVRAGKNYGWPLFSCGQEYETETPVGQSCTTNSASNVVPLSFWETSTGDDWSGYGKKSSIAPSGLTFFTGKDPIEWRGSLFSGSLAGKALWRLKLNGSTVVGRERLLTELGERIRDVRQSPDGKLYIVTDGDSGRILRLN